VLAKHNIAKRKPASVSISAMAPISQPVMAAT